MPVSRVKPLQMPGGLQQRLEFAINNVRHRDLETTNGFWTVFHGIIGLGPSVTLRYPHTDKRVNALDYICSGGEVRGMEFIPTREGMDVALRLRAGRLWHQSGAPGSIHRRDSSMGYPQGLQIRRQR